MQRRIIRMQRTRTDNTHIHQADHSILHLHSLQSEVKMSQQAEITLKDLGLDIIRVVFGSLWGEFDRTNAEKNHPDAKDTIALRSFRTVNSVCKEWNEMAWRVFDFTLWGGFPLFRMVMRNSPSGIQKLLKFSPINPSMKQNWALRHAAALGHVEILLLLLKDERTNPADVDCWALRAAATNNYADVVHILLLDGRSNPKVLESFNLHYDPKSVTNESK
eukprot:TRINITY_DN6866_c0_g1_i2.p1 TRINITY_DN6866_c0_g1~~TRINITY_DN6866_c0_g1_i2.p1  ORF type:complete len:219 (-),score=49.74 TRINITY_DN6866_c0_g1_i2:10-666(-)